eukprot:TRINITY_DN5966_c0_g1_i1.p1 TRINITY_DN5966_c0_g1~~TRINITY_DN5966_c0_g1_i1.p1  ORF type:complete len:229 (-),score=59.83 TRINITY_DN5966_c0_g1_i1:45-731(-)
MAKDIMVRRLLKELEDLETPPPGISCWPVNENDPTQLEAFIIGPEGTPYEGGHFKLSVQIPDTYPNVPPFMQFITKIYHPNIDEEGRICLDSLKTGKQGAWKPSLNIRALLLQLSSLIAEPNPDDPLVPEISKEFESMYEVFAEKARRDTEKYAIEEQGGATVIETVSNLTVEKKIEDDSSSEHETSSSEHDSSSDDNSNVQSKNNKRKRDGDTEDDRSSKKRKIDTQ